MDADGARFLRQADYTGFHFAGGQLHQVGQLVYDKHYSRQWFNGILIVRIYIAVSGFSQQGETPFHFIDCPF